MKKKDMTAKTGTMDRKGDTFKWMLASFLMIGALVGTQYYEQAATLWRFLGLLVALSVSGTIVFSTDKGQQLWQFVKGAQIEAKKVVWPSRKETLQATMVVVGVVFLMAIFLWIIDTLLLWITSMLMS